MVTLIVTSWLGDTFLCNPCWRLAGTKSGVLFKGTIGDAIFHGVDLPSYRICSSIHHKGILLIYHDDNEVGVGSVS